MAKKEKQESQEEQSERFRKLVQDMVDAGELNPTEADRQFDPTFLVLLSHKTGAEKS